MLPLATPPRPWTRALRWTLAGAVALGVAATLTPAAAGRTTVTVPTDVPTHVRLSSFNLLGYGHTAPGGDRNGWADGVTRMNWAVRIITSNHAQVIGFQEMQKPQYQRFHQLLGSQYGTYPGNQLTTAAMANTIAWQRSTWELVDARTIQIPYFHGNLIRMPYVLLRNRLTGREAWFYNSHNPADAHGPAQRWRNAAVRIEIGLFNQLRTDYPTTPVISTGDENDKAQYFCPVATQTDMRASNGGGVLAGTCVAPAAMHVDWVMGSTGVSFTWHDALHTALVRKTTDHFVVMADAVLPSDPVLTTQTTHAVVLTLDGLTSRAVKGALAGGTAPHLAALAAGGASTLNARTEAEGTGLLSTLGGILTGRPVDPTVGGTGVGWPGDPGGTVANAAGHYVSSVFDIVHNAGRHTALYSSRSAVGRLATSWDAANGGVDPVGLDNGTAKIGRYVPTRTDAELVDSLVAQLSTKPPTLAVAQLSALSNAGIHHGFRSPEYAASLAATDRLVGRVVDAIAANPALAGHTLLVVTANRGGSRKTSDPTTLPSVYRVPLLVSGPGVLPGGDLYAMNPQYTDPGSANPGYDLPAPIRNTLVADLVTKQLGLPPVPGSTMGWSQDFTVLAPPAPPLPPTP
ncbi:alkaline phosphatase family protein [Nocardioides cynanchi]|uniref:alkaline phosphatase family protein n=1 Tax=Nocardioides cynanchi TaxID=2558918 RepID=UPI001780E8EA|nr:alkaline phosphatase family protein [Nocardioides cynanchi]